MKETLMLLRPELRHSRIVETVQKSITIADRMQDQQKGTMCLFFVYPTSVLFDLLHPNTLTHLYLSLFHLFIHLFPKS